MTFCLDVLHQLPQAPGVYAIYEDGRLSYIGSAVDLNRRLRAHCSSQRWGVGGKHVTVKFSLSERDWRLRERGLIKRLTPPFNQQWHPVNGKNLRQRFVAGRWMCVTVREALQIESEARR